MTYESQTALTRRIAAENDDMKAEVAALRLALDQSLERERALWLPGWTKAALQVWRARRMEGANT